MSLPKEPRQLMINLMYLVLTALLAMNVSSEILNAFKTIGKSIENSNKSTIDRNAAVTGAFSKYINDPKTLETKKVKVQAALLLANTVNQKTKDIIAQIDNYKEMIIKEAGGRLENGEYKAIDNLDAGTHIMVDQGNGPKLMKMLQDFKDEIAGQVPLDGENIVAPGKGQNKEIYDILPLNFNVEKNAEGEIQDWSTANFHMSPLIANVTLLDKYKNDVLACQSVALDNIWSKATGEKVDKEFINPVARTMDDYVIMVSADNNYLLPGEKYKARIVLGTYNKRLNNLRFNVGGQTITAVNGVAEYTAIASGSGPKTFSVTATFMDSVAGNVRSVRQRTVTLEKPAQYFVGEAQASISLDKMNVFYIGVDNPITLSASGVTAGNLVATPEGCTLTKSAGVNKYLVRVTSPGKSYISLSAKLSDGTTKNFGKYEYRVKYIPDPKASFANKFGGVAGANELKSQIGIVAKLENFDFDAKFNVISYEYFYQPKRGTPLEGTMNGMFTNVGDIKSVMDKLKPGDKLFFDRIMAVGPDKRPRNLGTLAFSINN
jgi:gliding motility-associated protein GldM